MKTTVLIILTLLVSIVIVYWVCLPDNTKARLFGGTMEIKVEPGYKIIMATFKGDDLFYMVEPMDSGYTPKVKVLREKSKYGVIEGEVKFIESWK